MKTDSLVRFCCGLFVAKFFPTLAIVYFVGMAIWYVGALFLEYASYANEEQKKEKEKLLNDSNTVFTSMPVVNPVVEFKPEVKKEEPSDAVDIINSVFVMLAVASAVVVVLGCLLK